MAAGEGRLFCSGFSDPWDRVLKGSDDIYREWDGGTSRDVSGQWGLRGHSDDKRFQEGPDSSSVFRAPVGQLNGPGIEMAKDTPKTWLGVRTSSRWFFAHCGLAIRPSQPPGDPTDDILCYGSGLYQVWIWLVYE